MKFRTLDELSSFLREDLAWRRKENLALQTLVKSSAEAKKQAVLRGAIAALYAHWEGYVKTSCRAYYEYIKQKRPLMKELCVPILSIVLRGRLKRVVGDQTVDSHLEFADWLLHEWANRAKLPATETIITTSNLTSVVFKGFIVGLGLPYVDDYAYAEKPIIDNLVNARNHLAHGEWLIVREDEYDSFYMWISRLMEKLCEEIETAAATGAYRRSLQQIR
jgi:hypothetical protein